MLATEDRPPAERDPEPGDRRDRPSALAVVAVAVSLLAAIAVAVTWSDDDGPPPPGETDSSVDGIVVGDQPEPLDYVVEAEAAVGTAAILSNDDTVIHTFTSDDGFFDSGPVEPGESAKLPSLPAGTYGYHCSIHPALVGELVIRD